MFKSEVIIIFSHSVSLTQYVVLSVCPPACLPVCLSELAYCLNDQAYFAWFTSGVPRGQLWGRRKHSMKVDLRWKTTFDERRPLMEDNLRWKTTLDGGQPSREDDLRWKQIGARKSTPCFACSCDSSPCLCTQLVRLGCGRGANQSLYTLNSKVGWVMWRFNLADIVKLIFRWKSWFAYMPRTIYKLW